MIHLILILHARSCYRVTRGLLCVWLVVYVGFIFQQRSHVSQFDSRLFVVVAGMGTSFVPDLHHQPSVVQLTSASFCVSPRLFTFPLFSEERTNSLSTLLLTLHIVTTTLQTEAAGSSECYKQEGCWFDSRLRHWILQLKSFQSGIMV
jgi:hypothetical protein